MFQVVRRGFFYSLNKLRKFAIYYVLMRLVLRRRSKDISFGGLIIVGHSRNFNVKYALDDLREELEECVKLFDCKEDLLRKQRLNYLISFDNDSNIVLHRNYRELLLKSASLVPNLDTYTVSEIALKHILTSCFSQESLNNDFLILLLNRIYSRLEFHPLMMTNNHFFRNLLAGISISVVTGQDRMVRKFGSFIVLFIRDYFSEEGLLVYEKSSHYQALFLKWQLEILYIFKYHGIFVDFLNFFKENVQRNLENYLQVLDKKIFLGDITPDMSSRSLFKALHFYSNLLGESSAARNFFDWRSGHGLFYLEKDTLVYFIQDGSVFGSSHGHLPSFNLVINKSGLNVIGDLGRTNYSADFDFQTLPENHTSIYILHKRERIYLDFNFSSADKSSVLYELRNSHAILFSGTLRIGSFEDYVLLEYNITLKRPKRLGFTLIIRPDLEFELDCLTIISVGSVQAADDYGISASPLNRVVLMSKGIDTTHSLKVKIRV